MNKFVLMLLILNLRESLPIQFSITTKVSSLIRLHKLLIRSLSGADLFSIHIFFIFSCIQSFKRVFSVQEKGFWKHLGNIYFLLKKNKFLGPRSIMYS